MKAIIYLHEENNNIGIHGYYYSVTGEKVKLSYPGITTLETGYAPLSKPHNNGVNPEHYIDGFIAGYNDYLSVLIEILEEIKNAKQNTELLIYGTSKEFVKRLNENGIKIIYIGVLDLDFGAVTAKNNIPQMVNEPSKNLMYFGPKQYWKPNTAPHPLFMRGKVFSVNNNKLQNRYVYRVIRYDKKEEPGSKKSLASYRVYLFNKPIERIEDVRELSEIGRTTKTIKVVHLENLYNKSAERIKKLLGTKAYYRKDNDVYDNLNEIIVEDLASPGLSSLAIGISVKLQNILLDYMNDIKKEYIHYLDITDQIYGVQNKKQKIHPHITTKLITLDIPYTTKNRDITIPLIFNADIPDRDTFKRLEGTVKLILVVDSSDKNALTYRTILTYDNDEGKKDYTLFTNYYTSRYIL